MFSRFTLSSTRIKHSSRKVSKALKLGSAGRRFVYSDPLQSLLKADSIEDLWIEDASSPVAVGRRKAKELYENGQAVEAAAVLDPLYESNKANPLFLETYARIICVLPGRNAQALTHITKAISYVSSYGGAELFATKAFVQYVGKQYDPSIVSAKMAVARDLKLFLAHASWALSLSGLKQYYPSLSYYDDAFSLKQDPQILYWKGQSLYYLDRVEEAREWLHNPIAQHHRLRGEYYSGLKDFVGNSFADALAHFEKAKTGRSWNTSDNSDVLSWKGECYLHMEDPEKAITCFDQAIAKNKDDALSYHGKGAALKLLKKDDESTQNFKKAMSIDPLYFKSDYLRVKELPK